MPSLSNDRKPSLHVAGFFAFGVTSASFASGVEAVPDVVISPLLGEDENRSPGLREKRPSSFNLQAAGAAPCQIGAAFRIGPYGL